MRKGDDRPRRASIKRAIEWIAFNDNDGLDEGVDALEGYISVALIADLFDKTPAAVAQQVWRLRHKGGRT